ncbi:uncharacterized protein YndB with AHSA1/START domain [Ilumatobacter fluminis]|uniref:Uncharacterized protein YndB with AHSA1/START domain n=1 Tax=Ilumatobacter fluminis TaxID=467091 RepID=A0A4R7HZD4_9ACTN|nr:uncharacterized protein YndB with AHSA1/START domain [Ilumatobacter fluminis]
MAAVDDVDLEFELPAPSDVVFEYLTRIDLLTTWWPTGGRTDPREGGEYVLEWDGPGVTLRGRYVVVDPPARLQFTWSWDHDDDESVVSIELMSSSVDSTSMRIRQTASSVEERDGYVEGWTHFVGRLAERLR